MKRSKKQRIGLGIGALLFWWIALLYPIDKCNAPHKDTSPLSFSWDEQAIKNTEYVPSCGTGDLSEQCEISSIKSNEISREEAKNLILEGKVTSLFQAHSLQVELTTDEGKFTTQEPIIDEVFKVWEECGELCKDILLATE